MGERLSNSYDISVTYGISQLQRTVDSLPRLAYRARLDATAIQSIATFRAGLNSNPNWRSNMHVKSFIAAAAIFVGLASAPSQYASAGESAALDVRQDDLSIAMDLMAQDQALRARIQMNLAVAKSRTALDHLLKAKDARTAGLLNLNGKDRNLFLSSLKFNEKGLTEFDLRPLKKMSPSEIYNVLSLFGMQEGASQIQGRAGSTDTDAMISTMPKLKAVFLEGYRCEERATCVVNSQRACTSNC
jgi:hypothetical protein